MESSRPKTVAVVLCIVAATIRIGRARIGERSDVIAGYTTHHVAADGVVWWLGVVRAVRRKGGQAANETTILAICYLDNRHRRDIVLSRYLT